MASARPEVLLLAESEGAVADLIDFFDRRGCHCSVGTPASARELVETRAFDFVISMFPLRQDDPFVLMLSGANSQVFYRLSVEDGCWWVPLGGAGRKSLGSPAVRSADFTDSLERALDQLKQHEQAAGKNPTEPNKEDRESSSVAAGGGQ
jgi:hypothetical protein